MYTYTLTATLGHFSEYTKKQRGGMQPDLIPPPPPSWKSCMKPYMVLFDDYRGQSIYPHALHF